MRFQICSAVRKYIRAKLKGPEAESGLWRQRVGKRVKDGYHYEVLTKHGEEYLLTVVRPKLIKK